MTREQDAPSDDAEDLADDVEVLESVRAELEAEDEIERLAALTWGRRVRGQA